MLHGCPRTATVNARNYNTMAILSRLQFNEIANQYPKFKKFLIKESYKYNDNIKKFLKNVTQRVEYLKHLTKTEFHDFIYTLKE